MRCSNVFISGCLEKGRDMCADGGTVNCSPALQGISIANPGDSLHALKGMVFDHSNFKFLTIAVSGKITLQRARERKVALNLLTTEMR